VTNHGKPPYGRYAFLNPYNLSLLAGATVASAATGHWGVAVAAGVMETVWMLFAPDSTFLRELWFDPKHAAEQRARVSDIRGDKFRALTPGDQARAQRFWDATRRVEQLANENPSMAAELVQTEVTKLDSLYDDFLELARLAGQGEAHLERVNFAELNALWRQYEGQLKQFAGTDPRNEVAKQNLEVLRERKRRMEDLTSSIQTARGQMDLLDNTMKLLGDEIMTMTSPAELGERLEQLRSGVSAIRETTRDVTTEMLSDFDDALASAEAKKPTTR
jgi:hypothetical protein